MAQNLLQPTGIRLFASAAKSSTATLFTGTIPLADSYAVIIDVTAATGTTPTLDVSYQTAVIDGKGTPANYYVFARHAQVTTSTGPRRLIIRNAQGFGEAGSEGAIAATGGALNSNAPFSTAIKVVATIGGTNPSYTLAVYVICSPRMGAMA